MKKVKLEVQKLFSSEKIQTLFMSSLKDSIKNKDSILSPPVVSRSRTLSDNSIRPSYNIRKKSTDFKNKGLIVPSTQIAFNSGARGNNFTNYSQPDYRPYYHAGPDFPEFDSELKYITSFGEQSENFRSFGVQPQGHIYPNYETKPIMNNFSFNQPSALSKFHNVHIYRNNEFVRTLGNQEADNTRNFNLESFDLYNQKRSQGNSTNNFNYSKPHAIAKSKWLSASILFHTKTLFPFQDNYSKN